MSFPNSDVVMLSVLGASILAGFIVWAWLSQRIKAAEFVLQPMTALLKASPLPANEVAEEAAPDSSMRMRPGVRVRPGVRLRAVN